MTIREFEVGSPRQGIIVQCNECGDASSPEVLQQLESNGPGARRSARLTAETHDTRFPGHNIVIAILKLLH